MGPSRAVELRRTQSSADVGAGATRVGPGAADAPAHRRLGAGRVGYPGAARRRGRVPSRRLRVPQVNPARALVPAPPARVAGGGARAQGPATLPSR